MLSIIIPVYNSEKYLTECIESLINQSYEDIEIILVDNNSTDNSINICREFRKKDGRIIILSEKKKGAAAARNCGIKAAKGKYITFVDSDDYVQNDAYRILIEIIEKNNCDAVCFSFCNVDEDGNRLNWYEPCLQKYTRRKDIFTGKEVAGIFLTSRDIEGFGWNKIFQTSYIRDNNFCFDEDKTAYEDIVLCFNAILGCNKVALCEEKLYSYRQVPLSLTHTNYMKKNMEYADSVAQIIASAERAELLREAKVFNASREIWKAYDELKNGKYRSFYFKYGKIKTLWFIFSGLKSEKWRTVLKATIIYISRAFRLLERI